MTHDDGEPAVRIEWVEANEPPPDLDLRSADEWRILLQLDGTACAAIRLPSPGGGTGRAFITAALLRHADGSRAEAEFLAGFRRRLGAAPTREYEARSCSVVICTRRRPAYVADVLAALRDIDPVPFEVIVVDNDPGDEDCRAIAERNGARYVREDRRGLNNARAAGARASRGDVVAFLDDDCVPTGGWLRRVPELFDDPLVGGVTGPAFPFTLETPAQRRRDAVAGFVFGLTRVTYDWTMIRPVHAGQVGAGANMMFRRSCLDRLPDVFPPDLDVGTPSLSGGDLYAFYRLLAAGYRITYDPASFVFHRHPADTEALRRTIRGYGTGSAAYLTKVLVEEKDLAAFAIWRWLPQQYLMALVARAVGRDDAFSVRLRWDYLRTSFRGPSAWQAARRSARSVSAPAIPPAAALLRAPEPESAALPAQPLNASVIVFGNDQQAVRRCVAELEPQRRGAGFEIVRGSGSSAAAQRNAGVREARGDVLVFIDADLVPDPGFVRAHCERCRRGDADVVLGYADTQPGRRLTGMYDALWWQQHYAAKRDAVVLTFADVTAENMSVTREAFERVGRFDEEIAAHDDWDWGARAVRAGLRLAFEPRARAQRTPADLPVAVRIAESEAEGRAEVVLSRRYGISLPLAPRGRLERTASAIVDLVGRGPFVAVLEALELLQARRTWLRAFRLVSRAAHRRGRRDAGEEPIAPDAGALAVEIDGDEPIPAPELAPRPLELRRKGKTVTRVAPRRGQWHGGLADDVRRSLARAWYGELADRWWTQLGRVARVGLESAPEFADVRGTVVVLGPVVQPEEQVRAALEGAGAEVRSAAGAGHHWAAVDAVVRAARSAPAVAIPLPGVTPSLEWLEAVRPALDGSRTAAVIGAGLREGEPPPPLVIHSRVTLRARFPTTMGRPPQYIAVRPDVYERLGGFDPEVFGLGDQAVVLDFIERALNEGFVIGQRDAPGLTPAGAYRPYRSALEWQRWAAAGSLLLASARTRGGAGGYGRLAARFLDESWASLVARRKRRRWWLGTRLALLNGCVRALRR